MKPDAVAIVIGVLALVGAAMFVQWLGEQPPDWSVVKAVGEVVVPPAITLVEER